MKVKRHILLKIDEELFIEIQKQAKKENRSKTNFITTVVKNYLKERKV